MTVSPLSGLLDAAGFGSRASDASKILDALEHKAAGDPVAPSEAQTIRPSDRQTVIDLDRQTVEPSNPQTSRPSKTQTLFIPVEVRTLPYNQAAVLEQLLGIPGRMTNYKELSLRCNMSPASVRDALSRLVGKGFAPKPVTVRSGSFQGFSFVLNRGLCDSFLASGGLAGRAQTLRPSDSQTVEPSDRLTLHSSSSFLKEPTTTNNRQTVEPSDGLSFRPSELQTLFVLTGAVGAYWSEEGLSEGQALRWCEQFAVSPEIMNQQLEWGRYDLEVNGRRGEVVKDVISWFYGHLRKTGGVFPRPVNYRSALEIRAEAVRLQQEAEREAAVQLADAEFEGRYQAMIADREGELFKKVSAGLSRLSREQLRSGSISRVLETELKLLLRNEITL